MAATKENATFSNPLFGKSAASQWKVLVHLRGDKNSWKRQLLVLSRQYSGMETIQSEAHWAVMPSEQREKTMQCIGSFLHASGEVNLLDECSKF